MRMKIMATKYSRLVRALNRAHQNSQWLLRIAKRIGALRCHLRRKRELRTQNFSDSAIKGLLG